MAARLYRIVYLSLVIVTFFSCRKHTIINPGMIRIISVKAGSLNLTTGSTVFNIPPDKPIIITFSSPVDTVTARNCIALKNSQGDAIKLSESFSADCSVISLIPLQTLSDHGIYTLSVTNRLTGIAGEPFAGSEFKFSTIAGLMSIKSISLNGIPVSSVPLLNIDPGKMVFRIEFSEALNPSGYLSSFAFDGPQLSYVISSDSMVVTGTAASRAKGLTKYQLDISSTLKSAKGYAFDGFSCSLFTSVDSVNKFPAISDDALLSLVQQQTFRYFWDFGHPVCGMARERNTSGDIVTTGGTGFGLMAMVVAMERGFITKHDGLMRLGMILGFLETCDRFHGAWPHWLNGSTGKVQPFSSTDDGGDIVETSYLIAGLLTMRQYLDSTIVGEKAEISRINNLFRTVEFDWYTNGQKTLYWTWSPDHGFNLKVQGYNETLITYVLAASSSLHSITADTYTIGYAGNGIIRNGKSYFGYVLPLGPDYGGPLFFTQYSFLGLDPRHLKDQYADYWLQNVNQSLINYSWCVANPLKYPGYGPGIWGLTASDNPWGYSAHSPANDLGVISPTAALSAFPYTPNQSMNALKTYYYFLGDRLWGNYGFYDAFDVKEGWWATSSLAIDQGPIICMIENYRSGLLWKLFMSAPEVKSALTKLGFTF